MSAREPIPLEDSRELDLLSIWPVLWGYKYLILSSVVIFALVALAIALTATPLFRGEVVVTEARESGMSSSSSLVSQFGGLASLAGVNLAGSGPERERQAILNSRHLAEEFIRRKNLVPVLTPGAQQGRQSLWHAVEQFRSAVLTVREDKVKGVTVVSIDWTDPAIAASWANGYVAVANELIRTRALNDSTRNIAYLNEQLTKTNVVELRRVLYSLIENETQTLMLANARSEYAFSVVDPAVAPEMRFSPRRTLMMILGVVVGLLTGIVAALFLFTLRRRRLDALKVG